MALKDTWVDKKNNDDYIDANDINMVAGAVIENEKNKADKSNVYTQTETNARISQSRVEVENYISNIIQTMVTMVQDKLDKKANADNVYTKSEIDNKIGSIDTALDAILTIQSEVVGDEA